MKKNMLPRVVGTSKGIVMLNNAATTPPFKRTLKIANESLKSYGALHRGAGPYASMTFDRVNKAINSIREFVKVPDKHGILFTQNTSSAVNLFIRLLRLKENDLILTSSIEHTSNSLPYIYNSKAKVVCINTSDDGSLDLQDLEKKIRENKNKVKLVTITGASNLSGFVPDIKKIANIVHKNKALLFIDAAQLAPHRPINMEVQGIDALAFSAHKIYAPFGLGVLVLPDWMLEQIPVDPGGGSIDMISDTDVIWTSIKDRHQTGTWNVVGIIALGESCQTYLDTGWKKIMNYEKELVSYTVRELKKVPGMTFYVDLDKYLEEERIGVFVFNLKGYHHALLSSILDREYNIESRAGTICNHKLVRRWFKISDTEQKKIERKISRGDRLASYGIVRISLGIQNTKKDIDKLIYALKNIEKNGPKLKYEAVPKEEIYSVTK